MQNINVIITIHATSVWNELGYCQGHCNTALSQHGENMAYLLSTRTDLNHIKRIYTSDLKRSIDTAKPLSERLNIELTTTPNLREGNWANYHHDPKLKPLAFDRPHENDHDLMLRAVECMQQIMETETQSPIFIVTHGAFLKSFIGYHFPNQLNSYAGKRTALNHLEYNNGKWTLLSMNDDTHLNKELDEYSQLDNG